MTVTENQRTTIEGWLNEHDQARFVPARALRDHRSSESRRRA